MGKGEDIIKTRDALKADRSQFESHWEELSRLYMPFTYQGLATGKNVDLWSCDDLYDSTPQQAALIEANGLAALITPREEVWMEYQPPRDLRNDEQAVKWYRKCSETAREFLESSNFYEEIQECYIESPVFGTASLFCGDLDDRGDLFFKAQPIGSYYIAEDQFGRVNCFYRDLELTAEQAADEFGEDKLPDVIKRALGTPKAKTEKFCFVHAVSKRYGIDKDAPSVQQLPWQDCVVFEKDKTLVREGGYHEFPFACNRYRKYGNAVWGIGPGTIAKGDARQLSFLNKMADAATEKLVFPPIKAPSELEGEIGIGPSDITYTDTSDPNQSGQLTEWATSGNIQPLLVRIEEKRQAVNEAFHVDLFKLFAMRAQERAPMTATEASLVAGEKLTQFSPVFGRFVSEMLDIILTRVFSVLYRAGAFEQPPQSVMPRVAGAVGESPQGAGPVRQPTILYKNKIVLAMQAKSNASLMEFFQYAAPIIQTDPTAIDAYDTTKIISDVGRNAGLPEDWFRSKKEVEAIKAGRAAEQERQTKLMEAEMASKTAANLAKSPQATQAIGQAQAEQQM